MWIFANYYTNLHQSFIRYMLKSESFVFGSFQENTYVIYDETGEGIVLDPGCYELPEQHALSQFISDNKIKITQVVNTHCHIDHVLGNQYVKDKYQVPLAIPEGEMEVLASVKVYAPNYGFPKYQETDVDIFIKSPGTLKFGNTVLKVLLMPGHSPGHLAFYHDDSKVCFGGDVLFQNSIGRTDLPGGDYQTLIRSIHEKMFSLPDEVIVYSGHGPSTTVGQEKRTNPFCAIV